MKRLSTQAIASVLLFAAAVGVRAAPTPERPLTQASFERIRASHVGRPLVVHLWGMTCGPCMGELPQWGKLRRDRRDLNLVLIQVDQAPAPARTQTLKAAGLANTESWYVATEFDEYLRASIDPKWIGDMPRTLLIAPDGAVTTLRGVADLQAVRQWLDSVAPKR